MLSWQCLRCWVLLLPKPPSQLPALLCLLELCSHLPFFLLQLLDLLCQGKLVLPHLAQHLE
eukprot:1376426-Alexandrium_andersonii.AAC.1